MPRLSKRERAAIRSALAAWIAGEHDDDELDGYAWEDMESALAKMQELEPVANARLREQEGGQ